MCVELMHGEPLYDIVCEALKEGGVDRDSTSINPKILVEL